MGLEWEMVTGQMVMFYNDSGERGSWEKTGGADTLFEEIGLTNSGNNKCQRLSGEQLSPDPVTRRKWRGRPVSQPSQDNDLKASGGRGRGVIRKPQVGLQ